MEQNSLVKRLEKLEKRKKEREWKSTGLAKQAEFAQDVINHYEELASRLESEYGAITNPDLKDFVSKGEKAVCDRLHLLKIADRFGWKGATDFEKEELGRNEKEEKLLRQIRKDHEAKNESKTQGKQKYSNYVAGGRGDNKDRYKSLIYCEKSAEMRDSDSGRRILTRQPRRRGQSATSVASMATFRGIALRGVEMEEEVVTKEEEDEEASKVVGDPDGGLFYGNNTLKNKSMDIKASVLSCDGRDDNNVMEGITVDFEDETEYLDELEGVADNTTEVGVRVVDALDGKVGVWAEYGAGAMVQQIISKGLRLNFTQKQPTKYREKNNKSFLNNLDFGQKEVFKLVMNGVAEEVEEKDILCCNPLSVAANKKGKKRLCLDLSRHVNLSCTAQKFRIESVQEFVKVVNQGDWVVYYDLKSAFHHISVVEKHRKYLGFCIMVEGSERFYRFKQMPFGYRDASRILTKVMRTPITRWRTNGLRSYIHIDDGVMIKESKLECHKAAETVRKDLEELGLVTSPDKCCWTPVQSFTWCGFDWDLKNFRVSVTKEKKDRIKVMAREFRGRKNVSVKEMAALTGLVISCSPAIGRSARFHTRTAVRWVQDKVDEEGWAAQGELTSRVMEELSFWWERLEEFSSQSIRKAVSVLEYYVCSDAGKYYVGGRVARKGREIEGKRFQYPLEDWETEESSAYRELRSMEIGLTLVGPEARGCTVRYGNDNYSAVKTCLYGSTKENCHEVAKRILLLCEYYDIGLEVVWRRRNTEEIVLCDKISKTFDLGEIRLEERSFWAIQMEFGPWEVDWFASAWSARLPVFASRFWTVGATFTDAFTQDWRRMEGFFHPPLDQLAACVEKIGAEGAKGVLVLPDWPGSESDSIMIQAKDIVELVAVRRVEFESPGWRIDNTFRGWTDFGLRLYKIK